MVIKSTAMKKEEILKRFCGHAMLHSAMGTKMIEAMEEYATQEKQGWVKTSERLPELIEGKDYSNNVFAFDNGDIKVMCYVFIQDGDQSGYIWANCYGDINGDAEMDDEYAPTHWMPLPQKPEV